MMCARPTPPRRLKALRILTFLVAFALALTSVACSRSSDSASSQGEGPQRSAEGKLSAAAPSDYAEEMPATDMPASSPMASSSTPSNSRQSLSDNAPLAEPEPSTAPSQHKPATARQVIYESWMRLAVHDITKALDDARAITERLGGFIQSSASARLVIRVPAARYDEAIASLKHLGDVRSLRLTSQDVTDQYTDLVARIDNLRALKARYEALLLDATRMEDRLAIERELRRITQDLQVLEEQLVVLSDRLALSTITLDLERIQPQHLTRSTPPQPFAFARDYGAQGLLQ